MFRYNDPGSVEELFRRYPGRIACLILEAGDHRGAAGTDSSSGFVALCREHGALLIFDEMITGFRWHLQRGAEALRSRAATSPRSARRIANGFSVSALAGRRDLMERGGLRHSGERVFLLSTTHGAEAHSLAAALETMRIYRRERVVETLHRQGERLRRGIESVDRRARSDGLLRGRSDGTATSSTRRRDEAGRRLAGIPNALPPGDDPTRGPAPASLVISTRTTDERRGPDRGRGRGRPDRLPGGARGWSGSFPRGPPRPAGLPAPGVRGPRC